MTVTTNLDFVISWENIIFIFWDTFSFPVSLPIFLLSFSLPSFPPSFLPFFTSSLPPSLPASVPSFFLLSFLPSFPPSLSSFLYFFFFSFSPNDLQRYNKEIKILINVGKIKSIFGNFLIKIFLRSICKNYQNFKAKSFFTRNACIINGKSHTLG